MTVFFLSPAHIPRFDECLKDSNFVHSGHVFERLMRLSPKLAEDLLNHHLDGNHDDADAAAPSVTMTLDFAPFDKTKVATPSCTSCRRDDRNESLSPLAMLADGHRDLIKNPLTEAFVSMKWQLFKVYTYKNNRNILLSFFSLIILSIYFFNVRFE